MEAIIIHPKSKEQIKAFAQLAKAFNLNFEVESKKSQDYEMMLKKSYHQAKDGKTVKIDIKDLWK